MYNSLSHSFGEPITVNAPPPHRDLNYEAVSITFFCGKSFPRACVIHGRQHVKSHYRSQQERTRGREGTHSSEISECLGDVQLLQTPSFTKIALVQTLFMYLIFLVGNVYSVLFNF